jgi:hypothetical protein
MIHEPSLRLCRRLAGLISLLMVLLAGCATQIPRTEREAVRERVDTAADETIETLLSENPALESELEASAGYLAARVSATKIPVVGGGYGLGVLVDRDAGTRTYLDISALDLGVGLGQANIRALVLIEDDETLETFRKGKWVSSAGSVVVSDEPDSSAVRTGDSIKTYYVGESGAAFAVTTRVVKLSVNEDLTDTGLSDISIPSIGFDGEALLQDAPRRWDRRLPFLAQKVIDLGYDLPLPFGVSVIYGNVEQDMLLDSLSVGLNGSEKQPFEFVTFENAVAKNDTVQLKLDAWLFPFMNVFGLVGKIDGEAPVDVLLDGNGMLDILGIVCPSPDPLCPFLRDRVITLPITAPFSGNTYGLGTVLAGGWNNWFVAIPVSATYADMDTTETEGLAITATPRFGRLFNSERNGSFALFAGGNYLHAELDVSGTVFLPVPGGDDLRVDYDIKQKNKDNWNLVVGGNWDITRRWSVALEYNGFIGSREALFGSASFRF